MSHVIYKIRNLVNGKFYVGSTIHKKVRFREHRKQLRGNRHHCKHLQAAWNKYGEECFIFEVVEEVPLEVSLFAAEEAWLVQHVGKPYCYNSGRSADAPWRGVAKEKQPNFGKIVNETRRAQISKTLKEFYAADPANHPRLGRTHSEESKAKMSAALKGKVAGEKHYRYGKTVSEEVRKKIGDAQRGVPKAPRVYTAEGLARAQENMKRNAATPTPLEFEKVKAKFPAEVLSKYDFSKAVYTHALARIQHCICPIHGEFSQYSAQFRKGRGCPSCGEVERRQNRHQTYEERKKAPPTSSI